MISNEYLYALSTDANNLFQHSKQLLGLNLIRFKHLVDNSQGRGFDCTYAQISRRHFSEAIDQELSTLKAMRNALDKVIENMEQEHD